MGVIDVSSKLHGQALADVETILGDLLTKSRAHAALLIDLRGFVLLHLHARGAPESPQLDALGSLIASNYSATTALARLFGESGFRELIQQGSEIGTYTEELGEDALLVTVYAVTEPLGRTKYLSKKTVEALLGALNEYDDAPPGLLLDDDWENSNQDLLEALIPNSKPIPKLGDA